MHKHSVQYAIPLAIVDGKSLADLAHGVVAAGLQPQMQDLLVCVQVGAGTAIVGVRAGTAPMGMHAGGGWHSLWGCACR